MDKLMINGGQPLHNSIDISGAKNAALPIICAALLTDEPVILSNLPNLKDIHTLMRILASMGMHTHYDAATQTATLQANHITSKKASYELVKTMRASILVLGPLLARFGFAEVSLPGGCAIGSRPVEQHIKGLQAMAGDLYVDAGYIHAHTKQGAKLQGARIVTDMITVTGTENLLMAACLAEGTTYLDNAACEPEVTDLANCLVAMGAHIEGVGTHRLVIRGVEKLHGCTYKIMPDRIETGTFLCAVAMTGGEITLNKTDSTTLDSVIQKLKEAGLQIEINGDSMHAKMQGRPKAVGFKTAEYPGFPTDMQAQFMAMNAIAEGCAHMTETIFENRFMHVPELNRLGAKIEVDGKTAISYGVETLSGATVMATDLRASAGLVLAGLVAKGTTHVERIYHLDRGYAALDLKLSELGANISRCKTSV